MWSPLGSPSWRKTHAPSPEAAPGGAMPSGWRRTIPPICLPWSTSRTPADQEDGGRADHLLSSHLPPQPLLPPRQARDVGLQPERHSGLRALLPRSGGGGDAHLSRLSPAQPVNESTHTLKTADGLHL